MAEKFNEACPNKEYDGARPLNPDHSHFFLVKTSGEEADYGQEVSITSAFEHHLLSKTVTNRSVRKVVLQFPDKLMKHLGLDKLVAQQKELLEAQTKALSDAAAPAAAPAVAPAVVAPAAVAPAAVALDVAPAVAPAAAAAAGIGHGLLQDEAALEQAPNQPSSGNTSINIQLNMNLLLFISCALFPFYLTLFFGFCS